MNTRYSIKICGKQHASCSICRPDVSKKLKENRSKNPTVYSIKICGKQHAHCRICKPEMTRGTGWTADRISNIKKSLIGIKKTYDLKSCGKYHASCVICDPEAVEKLRKAKWVPLEKTLLSGRSATIKDRLIRENIWKNECSVCFLSPFWNNKLLTLQLDHIDGNNKNNCINNLRLICPNCHTQTDNYAKPKKLLKIDYVTQPHKLSIKERRIRDGLLLYKCYICNLLPFWNGKNMVLELDHIDGNNKNNDIGNLRILCRNCHSQTKTFNVSFKYRNNE